MRIDMFVYNRCTTDARVLREAASLTEAGHRVRIIAVLDSTTSREERRDRFTIIRIERNPLHYRLLRGIRALTGLLKHGAGEASSRLPERPPSRGALAALVGLPYLGLRFVARFFARAGLKMIWVLESAARKTLLAPHKPLMFLDYYWQAFRLVGEDPPDVVHAHDLNTLPVAAALARRHRLRLVFDAHELYPEISTLSPWESAFWSFVERRLTPRVAECITVCESIADEISTRNGVDHPTVVLNCPSRVNIVDLKDGCLHSLVGLSEDEPIVLYQGGFAPNRGLSTVIEAASRLDRGTVVMMGWGTLEETLRELVNQRHLEEKVLFTEPVARHEVVRYAADATVGLIPYEPVGLNNTYSTPNKLFDYMAAGLPVAASKLPELIRFVDGMRIGATFEPGDPDALAATINAILADEDRLAAMRARAIEASERFTWENESEKLLRLYGSP